MEVCANCGRTIGNLEVANIFREHVVCSECLARLTPKLDVLDERDVVHLPRQPPPISDPSPRCPRCGYKGIIAQRGVIGHEVMLCAVLLIICIIPGALYYMSKDGTLYCPQCRQRV
jgi:DNA-directed RNA polymerase subunit RPC12/RpoP